VQQLIDVHCGELQKHVANNDIVRHSLSHRADNCQAREVEPFTVARVSLNQHHPDGEIVVFLTMKFGPLTTSFALCYKHALFLHCLSLWNEEHVILKPVNSAVY
jgi:hypothetical protein